MAVADIITDLVARGVIRKRTRFSRLVLSYPSSVETPYTPFTGIPTVVRKEILDSPTDYSTVSSDNQTAGQLSLTVANDTAGTYSQMLQGNDILQVEERYSDGAGADTGWVTVGTYLVDSITPSADSKSAKVDVSARDALKWLTFTGLEVRFWADTIRLNNVKLAKKVDPYESDTSVYVFVDGSYDGGSNQWIQTVNWSDRPLPRIYTDKGKRISGLDGALQILYGTGEILIDTYYYDTPLIFGGLGKPPFITANYARFCDPTDEREVNVDLMPAGDTIVVDGTATAYDYSSGTRTAVNGPYTPADWVQGLTVVVLSGQARNARFTVKRVTGSTRTIVLDRDASVEGLAPGDRVRIGESNRMESVLERWLLLAGFQNLDPDQPFYISEIVQSQPQLILPTVADFDYTEANRTDFMRAYQDWQRILPPFTMLFADEFGNVHVANTFQQDSPQYSLSDAVISGSVESSDADIVTRVIYQVRNRNRPDLCATTVIPKSKHNKVARLISTALVNFTWLSEIKKKFISIFPSNINQVDPSDKSLKGISLYQRVLFDRQGRTGVQIADLEARRLDLTELDNKLVFQVQFDRAYRLGEIHVRGSAYPYGSSGSQWWQIEYSMDGIDWLLLGDEFAVSDGPLILTAQEFGADNIFAQYLRMRLNAPSKFQTQQDDTSQLLKSGIILSGTVDTRTAPPVQVPGVENFPVVSRNVIYAALATFAVYEYDIIEAEAELGVDRFDFLGQVVNVTGDSIDGLTPAEPSWVGKTFLCHNAQFTVVSVSGNTVVLSGNPSAAGIQQDDGFLVLEGQRDADFALDVERRQRLGRRTVIIDPIDEVGFYIVESLQNAGFDYTLDDYAKDKAKEFLGERSRQFLPCSAKSVRPDAKVRDTAFLDLRRLDFTGSVYIQSLKKNADGSVEIKAIPFRDVGWSTQTATVTESTTLTTTPEPETTTTTDTTTTTTATTAPPSISTTQRQQLWP